MHPRISELLEYLEAQRSVLRTAVDEVPVALRERRPAPDRWSVAEVLEHLAMVERRIAALLEERIAAERAAGLGAETETTSVLDRLPSARLLDREVRFEAPGRLHPRAGLNAADAWLALEETRVALRKAVLAGDGLALGTLTQAHPALGTLDLYQFIGSVGGHEARHAAQIREAAQALAEA